MMIRSALLISAFSFCVAQEYRSVQERLIEFRRLRFEEQHQVRVGLSFLCSCSPLVNSQHIRHLFFLQRHLQMVQSDVVPVLSEHEQKMQEEYELNRFDYLDFTATGI